MRSTLLLAAALAVGGFANPIDKRYMVTEVELVIRTVTVFITPGLPASPTIATLGRPGHPRPPRPRPLRPSTLTSTRTLMRTSAKPSPAIPSTPLRKKTSTSAPTSTSEAAQVPVSTPVPTPAPAPVPAPETTEVSIPASTLITSTSSSTIASSASAEPSVSALAPPNLRVTGESQAHLESGADYQAAVLHHHNTARANHGAVPLEWSHDCAANAMQLAKTCVFKHWIPKGSGQGQNLEAHSGDAMNVTAAITEGWYKGEFAAMEGLWGVPNIQGKAFEKVGHLTQMLWKGSTHVGCTSWTCPGGIIDSEGKLLQMTKYTVCNYSPPGNVVGGYAQNVGNPARTTALGNWYD